MKIRRSDEEFLHQLALLLKAQGISGLGVAEIAARLRCSRRRLYEIAPTKEGLLVAVAESTFVETMRQGEQEARAAKTAARKITAYLGAGLQLAATLSEAFLRDLEAIPAASAAFDRYQAARATGLRDLIEAGIQRGELRQQNSLVSAELMLGAAIRIRRPEFLASAGLSLTQAFEGAADVILNGMLSKPQKAKAFKYAVPEPRRSRHAVI